MSDEATLEALTPLGSSVAGAIVCASIFFAAAALAVFYYVYTKYTWYDVVIIACLFRTVAYCCRAAYLGGTYRPALEGTFLAFLNAGYGASCAAVCLTLGWWYRKKPVKVFSAPVENFIKWTSICLCFPIICFGPIIGVIAAGCIFGAYTHPVLGHRGIRLRIVASYGLVSCNACITLLVIISCVGIFRIPASRYSGADSKSPSKQKPRMVALLLLCSLLLLIRGCAGVTALYETKAYVWESDHFFYPLDTLPELLAFVILCWPCLLARIACCWPREEQGKDEGESGKGASNQGMDDADKVERHETPNTGPGRGASQMVTVEYN